jgi:hypothetical protein
MLDDRTMGGTLSETRMKSILEESRKKFVEELDQRMPTAANNMSCMVSYCRWYGSCQIDHG